MLLPDSKIIKSLHNLERPNLELLRAQLANGRRGAHNYKKIYETCISIHQKNNHTKGHNLENVISEMLDAYGISYKRQATIDQDGIIIPTNKNGRRYDFIIDARYGDALSQKIVLSCKRSLRERFMQDANIPCKKLYMITMEQKNTKFVDRLRTEFGIHLIMVGGPKAANFESLVSELMRNQTYDQFGPDYSAEL